IGETLPCGFCGRSGRAECQIFMKPNSKRNEIQTKCQFAVNFQYKPADTGSSTTACRNVPILCGLCPEVTRKNDWAPAVSRRYNMEEHLRLSHSEYASPQQPEGLSLPFSVWTKMEITCAEELALGVVEALIP
ncbi:hypothetical protein C8R44DRAFT_544625, partial [Mycena epipterygia]